MKKIVFILMLSVSLFAKSDKMSSIPLPKTEYLNTQGSNCDANCMQELLKKKHYFSFLSNYNTSVEDKKVKKAYKKISKLFSAIPNEFTIPVISEEEVGQAKIAILVPQKKIRGYAMTTVNSVIAYLMAQHSSFDIEVFNTQDEQPASIELALGDIKQKGFKIVIAPVTPQGAEYLSKNVSDLLVFIPTIHSSMVIDPVSNILFGGISYKEQIQTLSQHANQKIAIFSDGSLLGTQLDIIVDQELGPVGYSEQITDSKKISLKSMLHGNRYLYGSSIFLNMPLVKSSLLASQLRAYNISPNSLLSTQINYHPMLLTLTQYNDRKKLYLANSIQKSPLDIREINALFDHSIVYDWVNYSTNVGLDYLFSSYFTNGIPREFKEKISGNQIIYKTDIMKASGFGFYPVDR